MIVAQSNTYRQDIIMASTAANVVSVLPTAAMVDCIQVRRTDRARLQPLQHCGGQCATPPSSFAGCRAAVACTSCLLQDVTGARHNTRRCHDAGLASAAAMLMRSAGS